MTTPSSATPQALFQAIQAMNTRSVQAALKRDPSLVHATHQGRSAMEVFQDTAAQYSAPQLRRLVWREATIEALLLTHGAVVPSTSPDPWKSFHTAVHECFNRVAEDHATPDSQQRRFRAWLQAMPDDRRQEGLTQAVEVWLKAIDVRSPMEPALTQLSQALLNTMFEFDPTPMVFAEVTEGSALRRWVDERFVAHTRAQAALDAPPERPVRRRLRA